MTTNYNTTLGTFILNYFARPQGEEYVGDLLPPFTYLGYLGVLIAFVLPNMGAYAAASLSLKYTQEGFTEFLGEYSKPSSS